MRRLFLLALAALAGLAAAHAADFRLRRPMKGLNASTNQSPVWALGFTDLNWTVGVSPALQLSATDPEGGAVTYALKPGSPALPAGVSLSSGGLLSGAPTGVASGLFQIRASDPLGAFADQGYSVSVAYPQSCLALKTGGANSDGVYTIDPDGPGPIAALQVYCDMTSDGGGWTLVHKTNQGNANDHTAGGYNVSALLNPTINDVAVLPEATAAAISTNKTWRVITSLRHFYSQINPGFHITDGFDPAPLTGGQYRFNWTDAWAAAPSPTLWYPSHGSFIATGEFISNFAADHGHTTPARGGTPGIWINAGDGSLTGQYISGTSWVR